MEPLEATGRRKSVVIKVYLLKVRIEERIVVCTVVKKKKCVVN